VGDTAARNPGATSYLYRTTALYRPTASASGPDLTRFPGGSVTAGLAGERIARLEDGGVPEWLVEGELVVELERP